VPAGRAYSFNPAPSVDLAGFKFPLVLKRSISEGTNAVRLVRSKRELELEIQKSLLLMQGFVIEEFLGATEEFSIQFFAHASELHVLYGLKKLSHFAPSYSTYVESLPAHQIDEFITPFHQAFSSLERGLYSAQLKRKADNSLALIEISCRLGNNVRIVSAMWPQLTHAILEFYGLSEGWRKKKEQIRTQSPRRGISLVEDILARFERVRYSISRDIFHRAIDEIADVFLALLKGAVLDDYLKNVFRHPSVVWRYYRDFWKVFRTGRQQRRRILQFVQE
jgi:hypothetical protein